MSINKVDLQDADGNSYLVMASPDSKAEFTQAAARTNISSGETHRSIFGKIAKYFSDLKAVAFSGSYTDLKNKPVIPSGPAADYPVANNDTTNSEAYLVTAKVAYEHGQEIDSLNSHLGSAAAFYVQDEAVYLTNDTPVPMQHVLFNQDPSNYVLQEDGTVRIVQAGIYLIHTLIHGVVNPTDFVSFSVQPSAGYASASDPNAAAQQFMLTAGNIVRLNANQVVRLLGTSAMQSAFIFGADVSSGTRITIQRLV